MWGILSAYSNYIKVGLYALAICCIFFAGWHIRDNDFTIYKDQVRIAAEKQAAQTASIQKQHELVTKGISDEYDAKLNALRNYYKSTSVWNNNGGSKTSGLSTAPSAADVATAYNLLAEQCAETTAQTIALQDWVKAQIGIK